MVMYDFQHRRHQIIQHYETSHRDQFQEKSQAIENFQAVLLAQLLAGFQPHYVLPLDLQVKFEI
jgi:hypothetical protein